MADVKVSALPDENSPTTDDLMLTVDSTNGETRKVTIAELASIISQNLDSASVTADNIENRTRTAPIRFEADGSGGAVKSNNEGPEVQFSGTPTGYTRGVIRVPQDWVVGTDIVIKISSRSDNTNSSETTTYYVGIRKSGDTQTSWNEQSAATSSQSWTANIVKEHTMYTIPAANIEAGDTIFVAWRISTALTGNVFLTNWYIEYTADS